MAEPKKLDIREYNQLRKTADALRNANKAWLEFLINNKCKEDSGKKSFVESKKTNFEFINATLNFPVDNQRAIPSPPNNPNEQLALFTAYSVVTEKLFSDLPKADTFEEAKLTDEVNNKRNNLLEQIRQLQSSLEVAVSTEKVEDKNHNLTDNPCTNQFLNYLETKPAEYGWTRDLLEGQQDLPLTDAEIKKLTVSWGCAIDNFVADARKDTATDDPLKFGLSATFAGFLYIHDQLETLYSRLTTNVLREESLL